MTVSGCSSKKEPETTTHAPESTPVIQPDPSNKDDSNFKMYYDTKIEMNNDANIYDAGHNVAGKAAKGTYFDVNEGTGSLLAIKDTNYYVDGNDVTASNRWFRNTNHLVSFNEELTTNDTYSLLDEKGNAVITFNHSDKYSVYVKPAEDDKRYGVLFSNAIYYISTAEVSGINEIAGETRELSTSIPVLMYHFFYSENSGETRKDGNYVEVNELDEHLNYLVSHKFTALTMREVYYFMTGRANVPVHSLAITIDDGDPSVHEYAFPVFQKYGLNATLFLICGWEDPTLSYDFWEMREDGLELQSHGFLTHQGGCSGMGHGGRLQCMDHDEGVEDTRMSLDYVDGGFVYCYPFGDVNDSAKAILKDAGVKMAFTTANGWITPGMDLFELPRVRIHGGNSLDVFASAIQ